MQANKVIQKKPKDGSTSPQRSKKDKTQKEERYKFQIVPLPQRFANVSKIFRLYADLIIMEGDDTLISDSSLYNHYKIYKLIEVEKHTGQRLVRLHLQNKFNELEDWRNIVAKIRNSGSSNIRSWAEPVKAYCERYEEAIQEFQGQLLNEKISMLIEINAQTKKIRQNLINTYPLVEFKSEFKNGHIELTEIAYSEKYLAEMSYTGEELVNAVFKGGIPMFYPLNAGSSWPAKIGLENWIALDPNGCKTPEIDIYLLAKDGSTKTVKGMLHYHVTYEGEAPGFLCYITLTERSKPCSDDKKPIEKLIITKDYVNASFEKEMEHADFLEMFYGIRPEHR